MRNTLSRLTSHDWFDIGRITQSIRFPIWRHRDCPRFFSSFHVPKLNRGVDAPGHEKPIIAGKRESVDIEPLSLQREELLSRLNFPNQCLDIDVSSLLLIHANATGSDQMSVMTESDHAIEIEGRRDGDRRHLADFAPACRVPEPYQPTTV